MKNVFGLNLSSGKEALSSRDMDGANFIVKELGEKEVAALTELETNLEQQRKKFELPFFFSVLKYICIICGMILLAGTFRAQTSFKEGFANAPYIYIAIPIVFGIAIILFIIETVKRKKYSKSPEFENQIQEIERVSKMAKDYLGIPNDSLPVDVLLFEYKEKDGKITPYRKMYTHVPIEMFLFRDESSIFLADHATVLSFNIDDIKSIDKVDKKVILSNWNKEEGFRSAKYAEYGIASDKMGVLHIKYHYSIKIENENGNFEILIPPYEKSNFSDILNIE